MRTFLIVAGAAWFILAWLMLLSLALAARRRTPLPTAVAVEPRRPAASSSPPSEVSSAVPSESPVAAARHSEPGALL